MKRRYFTSGTVAVSSNTTVSIPDNVRVDAIMIGQTTANFYFTFESGGVGLSTYDETNYDKKKGNDNHAYLNIGIMGDVDIGNSSGAQTLTYKIFGTEYIS